MLKNYIIPTVLLTSFMLMSFTTFKHDYNNSAIEKLDLFQKKDTVTWKQLARIDFVKKKVADSFKSNIVEIIAIWFFINSPFLFYYCFLTEILFKFYKF